jgi:iron(III) transport system substrate-binding protein
MVQKKRGVFVFALILILSLVVMACGSVPSTKNAESKPADTKSPEAKPAELNTIQQVATYEAQDRSERILAGAKKEGTLNLYTSIAQPDSEKIASDFEKKYGIKVNVWRASTDEVVQRSIQEARANRNNFDVVHIAGPEMEALHREKLLQAVKSPSFKELIPGSVQSHNEWTATLLSVFVQAYNTDKVKKEDLPKTYEDLLNPKWKGQLGIEAKDFEWFWTIAKAMGEEKGIQYFRDLVKSSDVSVRKGHSLLNNLVVSGEVPIGLTVYNYMPEQAKRKGAPIDWFVIEPAIARPNGVGVSNKSSHPNAAMLFYDYLLTDAQKLLVEMDYVPVNTKVESPVKNIKMTLVDAATALDENDKWTKLFEDIFVKRK